MIMLDTVDFPIVFLGAMRAGIVPVPLNTLLTAEQYAYVLADCRARVLFVSQALLPVVQDIVGRMPDLEHVIVTGDGAHGLQIVRRSRGRKRLFATAATHAEEPAFWLYSSGSTGMPKGVRHLHASLAATAETYAKKVLGIREDDVGLSAAKLFFAYGLGNALTFPMSVGATTVLNPERPTPAAMFALMNVQPVIFFGVPTLFAAMLNDETLNPSAAAIVCGSAPRPARRCRNRSAMPGSHGSASTSSMASARPSCCIFFSRTRRAISNTAPRAGRCPATRCGSSTRPAPMCADGEVGELLVDAPSAGEGYWNQRSKSRQTFEGHWTRTGDKYIRDSDGRYTFCGRSDDMFKVSGIWVSPFEVESALITHPAVLEAAVVPEADPEGLLKPKAFVVLRAQATTDGLHEALKEHVKQKIGPWKYPRWIEIVESCRKPRPERSSDSSCGNDEVSIHDVFEPGTIRRAFSNGNLLTTKFDGSRRARRQGKHDCHRAHRFPAHRRCRA